MAGSGKGPLPFAARLAGGVKPDEPPAGGEADDDDIEVAPGDIYASVRGTRQALDLEFILKEGWSFSVSYSFLPVLWWLPPGLAIIEYPTLFSVLLEGKEMDDMRRRIRDHRITWVREFDQGRAAGLASAVTRIDILHFFPSRDAGIDPPPELAAAFRGRRAAGT